MASERLDESIIAKTSEWVTSLFDQQDERYLPFHSLQHTVEVVESARTIGRGVDLPEEDMTIVTIAAWLHDIGYFRTYAGHEEESALMAREFLEKENVPADVIRKVADCILATRMPQTPTNLREEVLCDADMRHLGSEDLSERSENLRKEWSEYSNEVIEDRKWMEQNLRFMEDHRYFTEPAREMYDPQRLQHVENLRQKLTKLAVGSPRISQEQREKNVQRKKKLKKLKKKLKKLEGKVEEELSPADRRSIRTSAARHDRGIETMFRTTSSNHISLSAMADSKANILISVNAIIISIVASQMIGQLDTNPNMIIPTMLLLLVCLSTIVASILATRPKVTSGTFTQDDIKQQKVNLLFFGNFHGVNLRDYEEGMFSMMRDPDYMYGALIKDIYFLGNVLGKKYRYLRYAYNIFMYGLIASFVAYAIAVAIAGGPGADILN